MHFFVGFFRVGIRGVGIGLQSGTRETSREIVVTVIEAWVGERS